MTPKLLQASASYVFMHRPGYTVYLHVTGRNRGAILRQALRQAKVLSRDGKTAELLCLRTSMNGPPKIIYADGRWCTERGW